MENQQLLEYIGDTNSEKLIQNIAKQYGEDFNKRFPEYYHDLNGECAKAVSLVTVTDPNENEIKSIGMSCMNDLLNDNFGAFLKGILGIQTMTPMKNLSDAVIQFTVPSGTLAYNMFNISGIGSTLRLGNGATPATRQDFNIEAPFGTAPESNAFSLAGVAGWNSGLGQILFSGSISAGGSGAVSETVWIQSFRLSGGNNDSFVSSRDNISPVANFIIGQTINVSYILLMS